MKGRQSMECFRRILHKLLFPGLAVIIISVPIAAALLIYTFAFGRENSPVAYLSYVFSAYSLVILCVWIVKNSKRAKKDVQTAIHKNRLAHRYLTDISFKI